MSTEREEYQDKLMTMPDAAIMREAERVTWLSAYAGNNPRSKYHWQVDDVWAETRRREKPWLYAQGYNNTCRACGFEPTDSDLEAAKEPSPASSEKEG